MRRIIIMLTVLLMGFLCLGGISFGQAIENELYLITPVSKDVHDPALKAFAQYAKKKWQNGRGIWLNFRFVIPAQAGIQNKTKIWIPAFAGTT